MLHLLERICIFISEFFKKIRKIFLIFLKNACHHKGPYQRKILVRRGRVSRGKVTTETEVSGETGRD